MTVLARSKIGTGRIRRQRDGRLGTVTGRGGSPTAPPESASATQASAPDTPGPVTKRRRREAGGLQDEAVYTCQCGFVFQAPVSTSVDCPHCGDSQAW
jgi:hypothetical protein